MLAEHLDYSEKDLEEIYCAGLIHDVGKLGIDKSPPHTRDFSRELGGFSWKNVKHMV